MSDPIRDQRAGESLLWEFDVAAMLGDGDTLVSVTSSSLTDLRSGVLYPAGLSGSPSVAGTTVRQRVAGLAAGGQYRLVWLFLDSAGNTQAATMVLRVAY